jgi:hypothetical protein
MMRDVMKMTEYSVDYRFDGIINDLLFFYLLIKKISK